MFSQITETYAFLPRDAVTKFLANCGICKKSPRACSPSRLDDTCTESSSEFDILNYSPKSLSDVSISNEHRHSAGMFNVSDNERITPTILGRALTPASLSSDKMEKADKFDERTIEKKLSFRNNLIQNVDSASTAGVHGSQLANLMNIKDGNEQNENVQKSLVDNYANLSKDPMILNQIYKKMCEYYQNQFSSNPNAKNLPPMCNDLMNYYQILQQFYQQSVDVHKDDASTADLNNQLILQNNNNNNNFNNNNNNKTGNEVNNSNANKNTTTSNFATSKPLASHLPMALHPLVPEAKQTANSFQSNININIENSMDPQNDRNPLKFEHLTDITENKVTINSAGVSINVSSTSTNSVKISCKTTPPKKRYSIYNHIENDATDIAEKANTIRPINLNSKFSIEALTGGDTTKNQSSSELQKQSSGPSTGSSASTSNEPPPITSTYLQLMRSMGLSDEDALKFDHLVSTIL